ncbi:hypothetical protein ACSQ76_22110 [Roseovarius sp. B08]|uniref:hypothetical protein n=1 Tax=Roseovarius sp. B08 TaxID=3449223 RepID=UPI003EDC32AE
MTELLQFEPPRDFRLLFAARHVLEDQATAPAISGQYPRYHQEIREALEAVAGSIDVTDSEVGIEDLIPASDYVFSLMNRVKMNNGEVFVSTLCEYAGVKYLGASPAVRALAEDKHLAKHLVRALGVPTTPSVISSRYLRAPDEQPFAGPFFVKPRLGAASEQVTQYSRQTTWQGACAQADALHTDRLDALIEQFAPGRNVTVPIIGNAEPMVFEPVVLHGSGPFQIITQDDKLQTGSDMSFEFLDNAELVAALKSAALKIYRELCPLDYARFDFRVDDESGTFQFLEVNICCDISSFGSLMFSLGNAGISQEALVSHVLAFSYLRQQTSGQ